MSTRSVSVALYSSGFAIGATLSWTSRPRADQRLELVGHQAHQAVLDLVPAQLSDLRRIELVAERPGQELGRVADLGEIDAAGVGERVQRAEVAARGGEAAQRAVEVEQVDHEL